MTELKSEDIKATYETKSKEESDKYEKLNWLLIDTYTVGPEKFYVLAWTKDGNPPRP